MYETNFQHLQRYSDLVPSLSVKILCWVVVIDILLNAILFIILYCLFRQKRNKKTSPRAV